MNIEQTIRIDTDFTKHELLKLKKLGYAKVFDTKKLYDKDGTYVEKFIMLDYELLISDKNINFKFK